MALDNTRHPLLPPDLQGKSIRILDRIRAMPVDGGQPLPLRAYTGPAYGQSPRYVQLRTVGGGLRYRGSLPVQYGPIWQGSG